MGNVILACPAGTVTSVGTLATGLLLLPSVTTTPPAGATPDRATVPVAPVWLPTTEAGATDKESSVVAAGAPSRFSGERDMLEQSGRREALADECARDLPVAEVHRRVRREHAPLDLDAPRRAEPDTRRVWEVPQDLARISFRST
jgi:hypothetical protein